MKLAMVADVHLGNHRRFGGEMSSGLNSRFRQTLAVLKDAMDEAVRQDAEGFAVLGDLFDTSKPTPQEVAAVMDLMHARRELHFHLLLGNHDQVSESPGDHALQPFRYLANVSVYEKPTIAHDRLFVPFRTGAAKDWLPGVARVMQPRSLLLHLGVSDDETPPFLRGASDSIHYITLHEVMCASGADSAFAGNWHNHQTWRVHTGDGTVSQIVQCGALVPTGFDNPGADYGNVIFHEIGSAPTVTQISGGPRFHSAVYEETDLSALPIAGCRNYVRLRARPKHVKQAQAELKAMQDDAVIEAFEVLPDREAVSATAKITARAARSAATVDEAIDAYVRRAAMPDTVSRDEVLGIVRDYLAKNG